MRGWTHYFSGLAMATFFPPLLSDLARGVMWPVLAGVAGYLPDFLDFKFKKFLWKIDYEVDPAPRDPLKKISPRRVKINELPVAGRWRFYYLEGFIERVIEESEDYFKLREMFGASIREVASSGKRVRIPGYLDQDEQGNIYWNVADAPHPQLIASVIAEAIDRAYETGRMVTVKLHNIRMPGDFYRRYMIYYKPSTREIMVFMGPLVSTGGLPLEGTMTPEYRRVGIAKTKHPFTKVYPRPTIIDAFSGPEIGFERVGDTVEEVFIPWHRGFSHSITGAIVIGGLIGLISLLAGYANWMYLAIASILGFLMHVIEDQLGLMGSVLLPPLTKRRIRGLMLGANKPGLMNFATNWLMIALMTWNLNRYMPLIDPTLPKIIKLSTLVPGITPDMEDALLLLLLALPTIIVYIWGIFDRKKYLERIKEVEFLKKEEYKEALEEAREEVGGF